MGGCCRWLRLFCAVANDTVIRLLTRIRELRLARGLSQEAFAEKAGLTYKYYQHVESGRRRDIRISTLSKLAKACDLKLWELLNFDSEPVLGEDPGGYKAGKPTGRRKAPRKG
jgi:transcriptional regulator with XRE-family HTH domain